MLYFVIKIVFTITRTPSGESIFHSMYIPIQISGTALIYMTMLCFLLPKLVVMFTLMLDRVVFTNSYEALNIRHHRTTNVPCNCAVVKG